MNSDALSKMQETLDAILVEQRQTNGRVTDLEREQRRLHVEIYGDEERGEIGMKAEHDEIRRVVLDARAVLRVLAIVMPLLTAVAAALGARLAGGG